jgi:DNA-binding response OmpR family regulator
VLVADDEHVIADSLAAILRLAGFDVVVAYNAEESMQLAESFRPDIFLTDVLLGQNMVSGVEVASRIVEMLPGCRVLLLSGQAEVGDLSERARTSGYSFELLAKPIHPRELLAKLRGSSLEKKSRTG